MGQKTNPISLRLQTTNRYFDSCWYSDYFYPEFIVQDLKIQEYLNSLLKQVQYPTGRFFIQNSQKKIKIFVFFCSPLKSRKIRSNFFKVKSYKTLKKKNKTNQIIKYLKQSQILSFNKAITPLLRKKYQSSFTEKKNLLTRQKQQGKIIYLKYLLYFMYLQNLYASSKYQTSLFDNSKIHSSSHPIKKKIKKSQTLFNNALNNKKLNSSFIDKSLTFQPYPSKENNLVTSISPRSGEPEVRSFICFFNSKFLLQDLKNTKKVGSVYTKYKQHYNSENILKFYNIVNKLPYRKHIETVLTQELSLNTNLYFIKTQDPFKSALFLAEEIVYYLERRIPFRRIKNRILKEVSHLSFIKGIRIACSGRVGGRSKKAQRAKTESFKYGQTSLHVFSSRIDFASKKALTTFGLVGIKVWISYND